MSTLNIEKTNTGESLLLMADTIGEALAHGLNGFLSEVRVEPTERIQLLALSLIAAKMDSQLQSVTGTKTIVKAYKTESAIEGEYVQVVDEERA